jgi:hypothetical protein
MPINKCFRIFKHPTKNRLKDLGMKAEEENYFISNTFSNRADDIMVVALERSIY